MNTVFATTYDVDMIKLLFAEVDELPSITKQICGLPSEQILWDVSYTVNNYFCTYMITCSYHKVFVNTFAGYNETWKACELVSRAHLYKVFAVFIATAY